MAIEIKVPVLPESVSDATIAKWHKKPGEPVARDENLVDVETDKVVLEVVAPEDGSLDEIIKQDGSTVNAQEVIARFNPGVVGEPGAPAGNEPEEAKPAPQSQAPAALTDTQVKVVGGGSPAARRTASELDVDISKVSGSGKGGRVTSHDVAGFASGVRPEKRVPMTRLRQKIAERLLDAQQNNAILTTFNEINMNPVMELRKKYKDKFEKEHGIKLGFMSFFAKAVVEALKRFPAVNASIDGNDIVYHGFFDVGVAVSSPRGLVVPIIRDADKLSMAEIEENIKSYGEKARDGKLTMEEMTGGTFTISNGGVFGSLMSTPILNPPQSGILGMHKIEERPVVENGQIVIRPMMYIALSYDHRIIDGAESVRFLVTIKEAIEDPARLLLGI